MAETPWLYLFVFLGLLGLVCAVVAVVFANRRPAEVREDWWRDAP